MTSAFVRAAVACATLTVLVPATHAVFAITPADLTVLQGSATTLLSNTTVLRIFSGAEVAFPPARVAGALGVDDIEAIAAVPEPSSVALFGAGIGWLALRTRRRANRR
jgi:hypothetical protein